MFKNIRSKLATSLGVPSAPDKTIACLKLAEGKTMADFNNALNAPEMNLKSLGDLVVLTSQNKGLILPSVSTPPSPTVMTSETNPEQVNTMEPESLATATPDTTIIAPVVDSMPAPVVDVKMDAIAAVQNASNAIQNIEGAASIIHQRENMIAYTDNRRTIMLIYNTVSHILENASDTFKDLAGDQLNTITNIANEITIAAKEVKNTTDDANISKLWEIVKTLKKQPSMMKGGSGTRRRRFGKNLKTAKKQKTLSKRRYSKK